MKVIIAGSRGFHDYELLKKKMDEIIGDQIDITVISGAASGADTLGERYAKEKNFNVEKYPAQWNKFGKSAGYIRNREMALVADSCVCFWDGESRGTKHMIDLAHEYKLITHVINYNLG